MNDMLFITRASACNRFLFPVVTHIINRLSGAKVLTAPASVDTAVGIDHIGLGGILLVNTVLAFLDAGAALNAVFKIDHRVPFL